MKTTIIAAAVGLLAFWAGTYWGSTNIDPIIAKDNALLKEQVEVQKEMIRVYRQMSDEIRDKTNPELAT